MPNANYVKAARFERRVVRDLEADGCLTVRAAGSHGPFDVWAVTQDGRARLVQCKTNGKWAKAERLRAARIGRKYCATVLMASREGPRNALVYHYVNDNGGLERLD